MERKWISNEGLKVIACLTMLLDHIGAAIYPVAELRLIGRISFPIFCFLLAEGAHHTRNPGKYAMRLALGMVLAEMPFDFLFFGNWTWEYQSVMVTLLLGFFALWAMKECKHILLKLLVLIPFVLAADLLRTDYGGAGVLLIAMFGLSRKFPYKRWVQTLCMLLICWYVDSAWIIIGGIRVPVQMFAVLSMIPICLYSGRKVTNDKKVQWAFYLFYPVHLAFLWIIA